MRVGVPTSLGRLKVLTYPRSHLGFADLFCAESFPRFKLVNLGRIQFGAVQPQEQPRYNCRGSLVAIYKCMVVGDAISVASGKVRQIRLAIGEQVPGSM